MLHKVRKDIWSVGFVEKRLKKDKTIIRGRGRIALLFALMLVGTSVFLTGCDEGGYADETYYEEKGEEHSDEDSAESGGGYIGYEASVEIGEDADSASDFGNGAVNGGRSTEMRSVRRGSTGTRYGSSGKLEGTIAVVTILADDATTEWNLSEDADFKMYSTVYNNLKIGCGWIEKACAEYGRDVNFIWDWDAHGELIYRASLNRSIGDNYYDAYVDMQDFISSNIDSEGIKSTFGANGIIYMVCVDTSSSNTTASSTFSWDRSSPCEYEMCFMLMNYKGRINAPATFAHEILHTFGAPDLYYAGKRGITEDYVSYAKSAGTNDIMRVTWDLNTNYYVYDSVKNEVTDITAYYLGLTDYSETVQQWGLGQSDYAYYGETAGQAETVAENYDYGNNYETSSYGWWNMLDSEWEMSDWTYEDGEWYIYDEETGYFYIYIEDEALFAALDEDDNLYYFDDEKGEWVEE